MLSDNISRKPNAPERNMRRFARRFYFFWFRRLLRRDWRV
jgi:hypothetical protein